MPWPLWSAATLGSTPCLPPRLAWVLRKTWNVAQPRPTGSNFGNMYRRQRLSGDSGVVMFSDGKTNPSGLGSTARVAHSWNSSYVPGDIAASRALPFFGVPRTRLYRSEEHTSELQSLRHLVCRLLLEKKET